MKKEAIENYLEKLLEEEKIAFNFGKTFKIVDDKIAPCFDDRMKKLVSETGTKSGSKRNLRNMIAWWNGLAEANPNIRIPHTQ